MADTKVGDVVHFYDKISVAIVKLSGTLKVGDSVKFKYGDHEFTQAIDSMEIQHKQLDTAKKGDEVGIKVTEPVKEKTEVYKVE